MRDLLTLVLVLALAGIEAILWIGNPLHVPGRFVTARALGLQLFDEPGTSMEPAVPRGSRILVTAWPYWRHAPRVGDIVAFIYPPDPSRADLKRIAAAGGSSVEIRDGVLYVDGHPQSAADVEGGGARRLRRLVVPRDHYFVLGDNPDRSADSRDYGLIARDRIIGERWLQIATR